MFSGTVPLPLLYRYFESFTTISTSTLLNIVKSHVISRSYKTQRNSHGLFQRLTISCFAHPSLEDIFIQPFLILVNFLSKIWRCFFCSETNPICPSFSLKLQPFQCLQLTLFLLLRTSPPLFIELALSCSSDPISVNNWNPVIVTFYVNFI